MDNKRLFMAALLSVAVLLLWQTIFPAAPPPEDLEAGREAAAPSAVADRQTSAPQARSSSEVAERELDAPVGSPTGAESSLEAEAAAEIVGSIEEEVVLESDRFRATFSSRGAQLVSFVSKRHATGLGNGVDLIRRRTGQPYLFGIVDGAGVGDPLNEALFAVSREGGEQAGLRFEYAGPLGRAEKEFWLRPDGLLGVRVTIPARTDWAALLGPGVRNPSAEELDNRFERRAVVYRKGTEVERENAQKADEPIRVSGDELGWIGLEDNYFLATWVVTDEPLAYATAVPVRGRMEGAEETGSTFVLTDRADEEDGVIHEFELLLVPAGDRLDGAAYLGAKEYERLARLPNRLNEAVNLGFFAILAKPILFGLRWLHDNVTANWGWAIILMTVFIRLLLFPLTHKSFVSMQKMQEVNPKVQGIKNKYRGKLKDKQGRANTEMQRKMNEEVMALYKKEGVNPAGGCLPMLLQIPVLFAFYNLLSAAVELRHAPWVLWIQDLSAPDPYYALPIIMGASQFVQQKLTPSAADPMQRRMFMLMPFFFTILFLGFPSGMVLYWLTNNILGIVQQATYKRFKERKAAADDAKAAGKNRG